MCVICRERFWPFDSDELPVRLPCNHVVGEDCLSAWIAERKGSCPVCRYVFWVVPVEEGGIRHDWEVTLDFGENVDSEEQVAADLEAKVNSVSGEDTRTEDEVYPEGNDENLEELGFDEYMESEDSTKSDESSEFEAEMGSGLDADLEDGSASADE